MASFVVLSASAMTGSMHEDIVKSGKTILEHKYPYYIVCEIV